MDFETRLIESLQEKATDLTPSPELKIRVMNNISQGKKKMKKRIITSILVASLLIPTGAIASRSFLADELYGSFENVKKHLASATMEGYLRLDAKLSQAKGEMGNQEYDEFIGLVKKVTSAKLEYGDQHGNINYDLLPQEKVVEMEKVMFDIQPYFDRLNGLPSSKELLSKEEYNLYINSIMTYEKILVKSEINPNHRVNIEEIPSNFQVEFQGVRDFMDYVNEKQTEYRE